MLRPPPRSPLFPYTTLFRSRARRPVGRSSRVRTAVQPLRGVVPGNPGALREGVVEDRGVPRVGRLRTDRKSTRLNSSHVEISYAVFCLKKKKRKRLLTTQRH